MDKGNQGVESLGDGRTPAEGSDVGDLVEDVEDKGVRDAVKLVVERYVGVDLGLGLHFET